jgi:type I restriction enzyme S subunit
LNATATGTKVRHTAPGRIEDVRVTVPNLEIQERIAVVLSVFDKLIQVNKRRVELWEDLVQLLYREWFVHFRFPKYDEAEFTESELGPIPDGWMVRTLSSLATLRRDSLKPADSPTRQFEHFSLPAFDANQAAEWESGEAIKSTKYRVEGPSVLLSKLNPRIPRVWLAAPNSHNAIASTEFLVWTGDEVSNAWLWSLFSDSSFRDAMVGNAGGTSTSHQRVRPGDVQQYQVAWALPHLRAAYDKLAVPALSEVANLRGQNRQLSAVRDLLLPRLVTGQLDISDIDLGTLTPAESA